MPTKRTHDELAIDDVPHDGVGGSTFCPYTDTSKNYSKTRRTLGTAATLGAFSTSACGLPLSSQKLLDVGGGTGTFVHEVRSKFADSTLFEYDGGMIGEARKRLGKGTTCLQGSADNLGALAGQQFHAVTMNQVDYHEPLALPLRAIRDRV
jgi:ubiquinone/menaquinone biosynthesis C-methylase UbiE